MSLSPEQHAVRLTGITASEIASIVGLPTAYESSFAVWARKVGITKKDDEGPEPMFLKLGNLLEPVIADLYAQETGHELYEPGTMIDPSDPLRIATPDRLVRGLAKNVQIKKRRNNIGWGMPGSDDIPDDLKCQVQWEMAVSGTEVTDVPALFWGSEFRVYVVRRDEEVIAALTSIAHEWWEQYVAPRVAPPVDGSEETHAALMQAYRKTSGESLPMTPEFEAAARSYLDAQQAASLADEQKREASNRLRAMLKDTALIEGNGVKIAYVANTNSAPAWKSIADDLSKLYAEAAPSPVEARAAVAKLIAGHTPPGPRVLRVSLASAKAGGARGGGRTSKGSAGTPGLVL